MNWLRPYDRLSSRLTAVLAESVEARQAIGWKDTASQIHAASVQSLAERGLENTRIRQPGNDAQRHRRSDGNGVAWDSLDLTNRLSLGVDYRQGRDWLQITCHRVPDRRRGRRHGRRCLPKQDRPHHELCFMSLTERFGLRQRQEGTTDSRRYAGGAQMVTGQRSLCLT